MLLAYRRALAGLNIVTDPDEVAIFAGPTLDYLRTCPFLELLGVDDSSAVEFRATSALVLTSSDPRRVTHRIHQNRDGSRRQLAIPRHPIRRSITIDGLDLFPSNEEELPDFVYDMGKDFVNLVELQIVHALAEASRTFGKVVEVRQRDLGQEVQKRVAEIGNPCTVLMDYRMQQHFHRGFEEDFALLGPGAKGRPVVDAPEGTVIVVANKPAEVGVVKLRSEPTALTYRPSITVIELAVVGDIGVCVWGNAPILKIEIKP